MIGLTPLLLQRALDLLASFEDLRRPASGRFEPGQARFRRGVDENHRVAECVPASLIKDGRVESHERDPASPRLSADRFFESLAHQGVEDRLKVAESPGALEDDSAERPTINRPADAELTEGLENLFAEPFQDAIPAGALFEEDVADCVGVEDERSDLAEVSRHHALA